MDGSVALDRFDLNDQPILDNQVGPKCVRNHDAVQRDRDGLLSLNTQSGALQIGSQEHFINRLEQPRPKPLMDLKSGIDRETCELLKITHQL